MFRSVLLAIAVSSVVSDVGRGETDRVRFHSAAEYSRDGVAPGRHPRWRVGGTPSPNPNRRMTPYTITAPGGVAAMPTSGVIASPPEYATSDGVLFWYDTHAWPDLVTDLVVALTGDPTHDEIAYVVVAKESQRAAAQSQFQAAGADLSKVEFFTVTSHTTWMRDYGPHFIWQDGARAIVDSNYYPVFSYENFVPTVLADDHFQIPSYDMGLYYSGGNFQPGPGRTGFTTSLVHEDNPGFEEAYIGELFQTYQGIDTLYILPRLPEEVDGTGHIDMWFYLVDEDTVIIADFGTQANPDAITITNETAAFMESALGFEVFRVPAYVGRHPMWSPTHYTYTNAFRVNDRIFIPAFGEGDPTHLQRDAQAQAVWQAAAPEAEIIPVNCYDLIWAGGAIHCIVMQVPRHQSPVPSACIVSPDGGELVVWDTQYDLEWAAADDRAITSVDLHLSTDGGWNYNELIAAGEPNDGHFVWTVPQRESTRARIRVVARDGDGNETAANSPGSFLMVGAEQHVYDFSSGAGVDKWAWGYQSPDWSTLDGVRRPLAADTEISVLVADAYVRLAYADADGTWQDPNRYRSPKPAPDWETTHIFEFVIEEAPEQILDIGLLWEGYVDDCVQMELYVWDYVANQWSNHLNQHGENRYVDNQAAMRDAVLSGHIRDGFSRFLGPEGLLTLLLYGERPEQPSMHDYVSVVVSHGTAPELIPTVSEWGLIVLSLLLLTTGTLIMRIR